VEDEVKSLVTEAMEIVEEEENSGLTLIKKQDVTAKKGKI
jgi:hypothetical protein